MRHGPSHIIDVMATCVDVSGATYPEAVGSEAIHPMEGESLRASFADAGWQRSRPIWFEHEGNQALRDGPWKLVRKHSSDYDRDGGWELYNIDDDRTELNDMAAREAARVESMVAAWHTNGERVGVLENRRLVDRVASGHLAAWERVRHRFQASRA